MFVTKQDLQNQYVFEDLRKKEFKERTMWKWIILIGCFILQMFPFSVALNLTVVFVGSDWQEWTGSNQTVIGLTFTAGALGAAVCGPFIAKIFNKKINMRLVYSIGIALAIFGFVGSSFNSIITHANNGNYPDIYAVSAILWASNIISQIGVMIFSGLGVNNLISKWWEPEKRGVALGIAFSGASLGNLWMQQLLGFLARSFGNIAPAPGEPPYNPLNYQYATYMIMGLIGLVGGLIAAMVACRKPLPPISIIGATASTEADNKKAKKNVLEASLLVTRKYPPYWILAIGFLFLQMGTVHVSINASFVAKALLPGAITTSPLDYNEIVALGGTLFGLSCWIGNTGGGWLNDKLGPSKSIFLAGAGQVLSMICLMYSVNAWWLIYVYYVLSGLSVYVYTSTPSFISGRLYGPGQSNQHMSILGIFVALGFAIVNSISGSLTGTLVEQNSTILLGRNVYGNWFNLLIFAIVCMSAGSLIVSICCAIITKKGIKGLLEYSPTKYTKIIMLKHSLPIWISFLKIKFTGKDFRKSEQYIALMNRKKADDKYLNSFADFSKYISKQLSQANYSQKEIELITIIFYYNKITQSKINQFFGEKTYEKELQDLINKKVIEKVDLTNIGIFYKLSADVFNKLNQNSSTLSNYELIMIENSALNSKLSTLETKLSEKLAKIAQQVDAAKQTEINQEKQSMLEEKANLLLEKINSRKAIMFEKVKDKDEWSKFKVDYDIAVKIINAKQLKRKLEIKKENKIAALQKKSFISQFTNSFTKYQEIDGHDLLINYYNDKWSVHDNLITKKLSDDFERRKDLLEAKLAVINNKLSKNDKKRDQIFS